jgi:hypothetical protein
MAFLRIEANGAKEDALLVPGVAGRRIQVRRLVAASGVPGDLRLNMQTAAGPDDVLLGWIRVGSGASLDLELGATYALATGHGQGLTYSLSFDGMGGAHALNVWYEVVP